MMRTAVRRPERPLAGTKIVSLAEQFPGPYATLLLSDLGADVIQVERPDTGDPARRYPAFHAALNRGKRSIALDLKDAPQRDACLELIRTADVVIEGFRPGVVDRLGLSSQELTSDDPALVWLSISGFGQTSPMRDIPAHDLSLQAMAGLLDAGEGITSTPRVALADVAAGVFAALAVLAGLVGRTTTGRGGLWDLSMFDALTSFVSAPISMCANDQNADTLGQDPGYGCFVAADGRWIALSIAFEDRFWAALCNTVGLENLSHIPASERVARRDELRSAVAEQFAAAPIAHWYPLLVEAGVPCGVVADLAELVSSAHVDHRHLIHETQDGYRALRQPLIVDGVGWGPIRRAPVLGEHTDEVLAEIGLSSNSWLPSSP